MRGSRWQVEGVDDYLPQGVRYPAAGGIDCYRLTGGVRICPKRDAACHGKPDIVPSHVSVR